MNQNSNLKIVIVYDDLPAGLRARELVANLAAQLPPALEIHIGVWKFDCFAQPSLQKAAATETSEADMIIVASDTAELPARVERWIETCLSQHGDQGTALVALPPLNREFPSRWSSISGSLQRVAERRQASFFCPKAGRQQLNGLDDLEAFRPRAEATIPVVGEDVPHRESGYRQWGIND